MHVCVLCACSEHGAQKRELKSPKTGVTDS